MAKHKDTPAGVPAESPGGPAPDGGTVPKFGVGKPADAGGPLPRVIDPLERAVPGTLRFKVGCRNYRPQPTVYVLAKDEASARACYLAHTKLDEQTRALKDAGAEKVDAPLLSVTPLAD